LIPIAKPLVGLEEQKAILEVLASGQLASGDYVKKFETMFKEYLGSKYTVCTSNGTTALHAALLGAGIGNGDIVITTPFSFIATGNAILYAGAIPLFADIDFETFNIDPYSIEQVIKENEGKVKAILIVHLFGNPCDMDRIMDICNRYSITLIEDCAQAHGAEYSNKKVGSFGLAGAFSFYPTKNMTCGEGGMIVTDDEEYYERIKKIINHGQSKRYQHDVLGYNYRMTNISAAIGIEQLKKLEDFNNRRIYNASEYYKQIKNKSFIMPEITEHSKHVFNQFTIKSNLPIEKVINILQDEQIGYGIYYPTIIPEQPIYKNLNLTHRCPIAFKTSNQVLSIPVHPSLTKDEIEHITTVLNNIN